MRNAVLCFFLLGSSMAFGQLTDVQLNAQADVIRNETSPGGNTKVRIADMYKAIIDNKVNVNTLYSNPSFVNTLSWNKLINVPYLFDDRGTYNASGNSFPSAGGSGSGGSVLRGNVWTVSTPGTLAGVSVYTGQTLRALVDNPGQTSGNWHIASLTWGTIGGTLSNQTDLLSAINAKVSNVITDGVTDVAPSENAVFDANALKIDKSISFNRQTSSYTLVLSDAVKVVEMNSASANNLTVPPNSSVAFPIGTQIMVTQYGAGQTSFVADVGVTIRSAGNKLKIAEQYGGATLLKVGTNEWYLVGALTD